MFETIKLYCKWAYFLYELSSKHFWLMNTNEGGIYLKNKLSSLGVIGIKFGQYLYTQKAIKLTDELKKNIESFLSHNHVHTKEDTLNMFQLIENDNNFSTLFNDMEEEIIGSGSLAQTHICYLKDDPTKKYVIKIAHPSIFQLENEIQVVKKLIGFACYFKKFNIDWNDFFENISIQCDFNNEARYMKIFYDIFKSYEKIDVPELIYSSKYVIIMSYCEGVHINKFNKLNKDFYVSTNLLTASFLYTAYKYSICHGDLHPGNILVKPNGNITLIDFGICNEKKCIDNQGTEEKKDNENIALYLYKKFLYNRDYESTYNLLKTIIVNKNYEELFLSDLTKKLIEKSIHITHKTIDYEQKLLNLIIEFCYDNNLFIKGRVVYFINQIILLENICEAGGINWLLFRTFDFMIKDKFFMNNDANLREYILKFYDLEFNNIIKVK